MWKAVKWFPHSVQSLWGIQDKQFTLRILIVLLLQEGGCSLQSLAGVQDSRAKEAQQDLFCEACPKSYLPCPGSVCLWSKCPWEYRHSCNITYYIPGTVPCPSYRLCHLILTRNTEVGTSTPLVLQMRKLRHREDKSPAQSHTELGCPRQSGSSTCPPSSLPNTSRLAMPAAG